MNVQTIAIPEINDQVNVMMFGNNPAELSKYLINLSNFQEARFNTNFNFNLRFRHLRLQNLVPEYIVIDDCYPIDQIRKFVRRMRRNVKTHAIPVAILKTSNTPIFITDVQDFLLKESFTPDRLLHAVRNSRNIRKAQVILYMTYKRSRRQYSRLINSIKKLF
jgi:hypothetical protein